MKNISIPRTGILFVLLVFLIKTSILSAQFNFSNNVQDPVKWEFSASKINESEFDLIFKGKIEDHWHVYSIKVPENGPLPLVIDFNKNNNFKIVGSLLEKSIAKVEYDDAFEMEIGSYYKEILLHQRVKVLNNDPVVISGLVSYQSCKEGVCIPDEKDFSISVQGNIQVIKKDDIPVGEEIKVVKEEIVDMTIIDDTSIIKNAVSSLDLPEKTDTNNSASSNKNNSLPGLLLVAFGLGLASILTPCVYPIIPLTVSFFTSSGDNRKKAIFNAIAFGLSLILIYTIIGFLIGVTKVDFTGKIAGNWIANLIFFIIFLIFAISFFGVFEIVLPNSIANKVDQKADKGGFLAPFFMALATIIISFSCTGPIVTLVLGRAIDGQIITPTLSMFAYGLAFALPFTMLAFFPILMKKIPKSGGWLNTIKVVFAFILLAFGLKFLSIVLQYFHIDILSRDLFIALWISIFTLMGLYFLGKIKFSHDSDMPYLGVTRLFFAIITFAFVIYMIPGLFGAPLKMISSFLPPEKTQEFKINSEVSISDKGELCGTPKYEDLFHFPLGLRGYFDYEQGMDCARKLNKPVLLDFKGHSCSNCKVMENTVWSDPEVLKRLQNDFVIIALYTDERTKLPAEEWYISEANGKKIRSIGNKNNDLLVSRFQTNSIPLYAIIDNNGEVLVEPKNFDKNIPNYIEFLDKGKEKYFLNK